MALLKAEFDCEVLTPMFLSGVDQNTCELRAASLRGVLRYWYRALLGGQGLPLDEVRQKEAGVFGEAGREKGAGASVVNVRVSSLPAGACKRPPALPDWDPRPSAQNPNGKLKPNTGTGYLWFSIALGDNFRSFIAPGTRFTVTMTARPGREQPLTDATRAFWLLAHLGGIGTRARRAAGSFWVRGMRVEGIGTPPFRAHFDHDHVKNTLRDWLGASRAAAPAFDTLGQSAQVVHRALNASGWEQAVRSAGEHFKAFRFDNRREPDEKRAGFGLPLTVGYRGDERKLSLSSQDGDEGRRASPLHLRIVPVAGRSGERYDAVLTLLHGPFGPNGDTLTAAFTQRPGASSRPLPTTALVRDYLNEIPDNQRSDLL